MRLEKAQCKHEILTVVMLWLHFRFRQVPRK